MPANDPELLTTGEAARAAGVNATAIYRAAAAGRLRVAARTPQGTRLYDPSDIEEYRRGRLARLARLLRAAAEPRDTDPWDVDQSSALDLAVDLERRLKASERGR